MASYPTFIKIPISIRIPGDMTSPPWDRSPGALIQEMIWQRSAKSLLLCGPAKICEALVKDFFDTKK